MNEITLIRDLAVIWAVALAAGHLFIRLKQPVIAGYMLAGVIVGPHGLKWIDQSEQIKVLAEFGVAMLLFTLGVDLSLKQVMSSARPIVSAGIVQVVGTLGVGWAIAVLTGLAKNPGEGFIFGSICAISSSVVISRTLMDRGELDSVHGRILVPLSLVQDLCLVVIIPFLPVLEDSSGAAWSGLLLSGLKAIVFILIVVVGATRIMPMLLGKSAKANSKEIFLLTILVLCLGIALLSQFLGLSIALGAFLAGIMMSESTYAHQALHDVSPLRDIFSTIFFVSVGMLLDPVFIAQHWSQVGIFVIVLIAGKALIGCGAALFATNNLRSAILVGTGLSQIGEFSFVLLTLGYGYKLIGDAIYNLFFAGAVVSMIASPALMSIVPKLMRNRFRQAPGLPINSRHTHLHDHVIVCGFGRIGRNLGHVLEAFQLPFVVIELNANIIEDLAMRGVPHIYGDAMNALVLVKAQLEHASMLVLTMPDPLSAEAVAAFARERNPDIKIVARAHRTDDIRIFRSAGVNAVVQPEFEASIEITRLVLHGLNRPVNEVHRALNVIKTRRYAIFQPDIDEVEPGTHVEIGEDQMGLWFTVASEDIHGKSISDLNVRGETGATITAIKRKGKTVAFPDAVFELDLSDEVYAVGNSEQLHELEKRFALVQSRHSGEAS
jgi:CPA2 family monovalent cation:H+ antiporter-2